MQNVRSFHPVESFLKNRAGLVTLEWVAIASAVLLLGIGVISLLQPRVTTAASTVGSKLVSSVNSNS
jgi:hypothetical protein